ncbi:MAG: hypothetical protein JXB07_13720 [Anaerolineae bacterium]|nr:hypothetical protein [Anaerolineae bacterium]
MTNLLKNPSFEGAYQPWQDQMEIMVAEGWLPFWIPQRVDDETWRNRQPIYWAGRGSFEPRFVRAGQTSQAYSTPWGTHIAGLMQTVAVKPGQRLQLKAYGYAWSTDADTPGISTSPGNMRMKIGIDPTGGTTPFGSAVVWSIERTVYDYYDAGFIAEATAIHPTVTIFLMSAPEWPRKHNDVYWDDVSLEIVQDVADLSEEMVDSTVRLLLASETQQLGDPVRVRLLSPHLLQNIHIQVSGPVGSVGLRQLDVASTEREHAWRWEFEPVAGGPYTVTVSADETDAITATILIGSDAANLTLIPQSISDARGKPRAQYERTYVLMPPCAGKEWLRAVLDSGVLTERGWSMGFNRDDAGIGDLDSRAVIVVNPADWPEPIEAWFAFWYPGVIVHAVSADSPDDLQVALCSVAI